HGYDHCGTTNMGKYNYRKVIQSCATGDLNFTSTQQHTSSRQQLHIQAEIAGVLEEYLDYKRQHNDKLFDVVNQIDQKNIMEVAMGAHQILVCLIYVF
ncbi:hypothetical protein ACJX0J_026190, partial [Zea mays]